MKEYEVRALAKNGYFQNEPIHGQVEETHISWVILTRSKAFKIKKPLTLSFLDFSTLALRKHFCEKELQLNSRFSHIYLSVLPVHFANGHWHIGGNEGDALDYAVVMKRMASSKRMDVLLKQRKISNESIKALAVEVASFHQKAEKVFVAFDLQLACNTFNDITLVSDYVSKAMGGELSKMINASVKWSDSFLKLHADRIRQRIDNGFKRDVHGDLHSGNIFIYKRPVLFDCIEFNDQYRQIDVLYEIAFLCMDLEAFGQPELSGNFFSEYIKHFDCFDPGLDEDMFIYFKCLRANIRAKVHAMSASQADNEQELIHHSSETEKYLKLMKAYMRQR